MMEQDSKTLENTEGVTHQTEVADEQAKESEAPKADYVLEAEGDAADDQSTTKSGSEDSADEGSEGASATDLTQADASSGENSQEETVAEVSEEFAETAAGREATGEGADGGPEPGEEEPDQAAEHGAGADIEVEAADQPSNEATIEPEDSAADYPPWESVAPDEGPGGEQTDAEAGDDKASDAPVENSPFPPEVEIGVSAVETLPDDTGKEAAAKALLDDVATKEPREAADDEQIDNSDRVEKPVVENEPAPERVPAAPGGDPTASTSESLEVMDLAGDADASEPDKAMPDQVASGDADATDPAKSAPIADVGDETSGPELLDGSSQPGDPATDRPDPTELGDDDPAGSLAPTPPTGTVNQDASPPLAGPARGIDDPRLENRSIADPLGQGDGPGPVDDSSGIQSGGVASASFKNFDDGAYSVTVEREDGSQVIMTQETDGSYVETEVSADGTEVTQTTSKDGKVVETRRETTEPDGTLVTEKTTYDESGQGTQTTTTQKEIEKEEEKEEDKEKEDDDSDTSNDNDGSESQETSGSSQSGDQGGGEESASRPVDDGLVDPERLAAMHQEEAEFQQSVRESSTINPVRTDAGAAEGGGDPPPGVDDPPEDESPRPDELPNDDPAEIGASGGNIDFGPDHVEESEASAGNPGLTEDLGTQSGQQGTAEANPVDSYDSISLDPGTIQEQTDDILDAMSGVAPDDAFGFGAPYLGWDSGAEADPDEDQGASGDADDLF